MVHPRSCPPETPGVPRSCASVDESRNLRVAIPGKDSEIGLGYCGLDAFLVLIEKHRTMAKWTIAPVSVGIARAQIDDAEVQVRRLREGIEKLHLIRTGNLGQDRKLHGPPGAAATALARSKPANRITLLNTMTAPSTYPMSMISSIERTPTNSQTSRRLG